jgi:hypothetical protein
MTGRHLAIGLLALLVTACSTAPSGSPSATAIATATPTLRETGSGSPGPTQAPPLSLAMPTHRDAREVSVKVDPRLPDNGDGQIVVTVTSHTDRRIRELVLRWPTELRDSLFLAPFAPSEQRIREFGPPLHQDWTKWVDGPGESGEPAGTTSLGWGPLFPGATLTIPILVTRRVQGSVAFDLQALAGEAILTQPDGSPAELRVSVP